MHLWQRAVRMVRALTRRDALDRDLDDELRDWVDTLAERYQARGLTPADARRAALVEIGGVESVKTQVRDHRTGNWVDTLLVDCRSARRALTGTPALTAVAILTLAFGIAANASIFSIVHALLLRPLPYRDADRLAMVWINRTEIGYPRTVLSGPDLRALREETNTFVDFGAIWASSTVALTDEAHEPEQLRSAFVTTNFFDVLGADAALGRTFREADSAPGADATILIGWDLFQRRFGGDRSITRKIPWPSSTISWRARCGPAAARSGSRS